MLLFVKSSLIYHKNEKKKTFVNEFAQKTENSLPNGQGLYADGVLLKDLANPSKINGFQAVNKVLLS